MESLDEKQGSVRLAEFSVVWAYIPVQWLATLAFFFATVQTRVEALDLAPDLEQAVLIQLIPALYLERVAGRSHAETRHRLQGLSARLLDPLRQPTPSATGPRARASHTHRGGRSELRRSVPVQQFLRGRPQRTPLALSPRLSRLKRPQAGHPHR
jgi:hypothetical protein